MKTSNRIEFDEDEMPCPCAICGGWFDLNDGKPNPYKENEVICEECGDRLEVKKDVEDCIETLEEENASHQSEIEFNKKELEKLKSKLASL